MKTRKLRVLFAILASLAMFAAACGSDSAVDTVTDAASDAADAATDAVDDAAEAVEDAVTDDEPAAAGAEGMPGEGVTASMGRANWSSGYVQAQILHNLMEELGYDVSSPDELEFAPDLGYQTMAEGDMDFTSSAWKAR